MTSNADHDVKSNYNAWLHREAVYVTWIVGVIVCLGVIYIISSMIRYFSSIPK